MKDRRKLLCSCELLIQKEAHEGPPTCQTVRKLAVCAPLATAPSSELSPGIGTPKVTSSMTIKPLDFDYLIANKEAMIGRWNDLVASVN